MIRFHHIILIVVYTIKIKIPPFVRPKTWILQNKNARLKRNPFFHEDKVVQKAEFMDKKKEIKDVSSLEFQKAKKLESQPIMEKTQNWMDYLKLQLLRW